jgi:hypothetical protein
MKTLRKIAAAAIILSSVSAAFAGPGPQYWARPIQTDVKAKEVKATDTKSKSDKRTKAVQTAKQDAKVDVTKGK